MTKLNKFKCRKYGGNNLDYEKWVNSREAVIFRPDGHIEYAQARIDQDDYLTVECGFICQDCGHPLYYCGNRIETEQDLLNYLTTPPEKIAEEEKLYEACEEEIAREQEAEEQERIESYIAEAEEISAD